MYRILIVEDDLTISGIVREALTRWGYEAQSIEDFGLVDAQFDAFSPHLVLMDVSLPRFNGFYWCQRLRERSQVPIIFLSSHAQSMDQVMAMSMGGDDYITKPFSMDVLLAKVAAQLRRAYNYAPLAQPSPGQPSPGQPGADETGLSARGALLCLHDATLRREGRGVELTRNECRILSTLLTHKGEIVSREALMKALWDDDAFVDDNTLTVNMTRLRRKLEGFGLPDFISTKKGLGYIVYD